MKPIIISGITRWGYSRRIHGFRYFYDWPFRRGESEYGALFTVREFLVLYGFTEQLYAGANISYQWNYVCRRKLRQWYFTVPLFWIF
ncbi:MAG: hypothetical protein U1F16_05230 [Turneriella sp.]